MNIIEVKMFGHSLHCFRFFVDNFRRFQGYEIPFIELALNRYSSN